MAVCLRSVLDPSAAKLIISSGGIDENESAMILRNDGIMVGGELVGDRAVEDVIASLFENNGVTFLHARTATLGCYIARIERA